MIVDDRMTRKLAGWFHEAGRMTRIVAWLCGFLAVWLGNEGSSLAVCGDGALDAGEECDDGNGEVGDGCSGDCTVEPWIWQVCSTARDGDATVTSIGVYLNRYYAAPAAEREAM